MAYKTGDLEGPINFNTAGTAVTNIGNANDTGINLGSLQVNIPNGNIYFGPLTYTTSPAIYMGGVPFISAVAQGSSSTCIGLNTPINTPIFNYGNNLCTAVGYNAMSGSRNTTSNSAFGSNALSSQNDTNSSNAAFGEQALQNLQSGSSNTACGVFALAIGTNFESNTAIGANCMSYSQGYQNTAVGNGALTQMGNSGNNNIAIGFYSGDKYTSTESNNILIGSVGVALDTGVIRIGQIGSNEESLPQQTACYIAGISGKTTGVADAVAVLIDSKGQLGTISSSLRYKENVQDMGGTSSPIMDIRPVTFNYKSDADKTKNFGFIAEEVAQIFPDLVVYDKEGRPETIKYHLLSPILLNELKKQDDRIAKLEAIIADLQ